MCFYIVFDIYISFCSNEIKSFNKSTVSAIKFNYLIKAMCYYIYQAYELKHIQIGVTFLHCSW